MHVDCFATVFDYSMAQLVVSMAFFPPLHILPLGEIQSESTLQLGMLQHRLYFISLHSRKPPEAQTVVSSLMWEIKGKIKTKCRHLATRGLTTTPKRITPWNTEKKSVLHFSKSRQYCAMFSYRWLHSFIFLLWERFALIAHSCMTSVLHVVCMRLWFFCFCFLDLTQLKECKWFLNLLLSP